MDHHITFSHLALALALGDIAMQSVVLFVCTNLCKVGRLRYPSLGKETATETETARNTEWKERRNRKRITENEAGPEISIHETGLH